MIQRIRSSFLRRLCRQASLSLKMLLVTLVVGVVVWGVLDYSHHRVLQDIFNGQLTERFALEAREDRQRFDGAIKAYHKGAALLAGYAPLQNFLSTARQSDPGDQMRPQVFRRPPNWMPSLALLRGLVQLRYVLVLNQDDELLAVYQSRRRSAPDALMQPSAHLLEISRGQSFLTTLDSLPFLVSSEDVVDEKGVRLGRIMLATPLDDEFLAASQAGAGSRTIVALLDAESRHVLVSSDPGRVAVDASLKSLEQDYLVTGGAFFDYGASDLVIRFVSLVSTSEVASLTSTLLSAERRNRVIETVVYLSAFGLIMIWVTRRITRLNHDLEVFCEKMGLSLPANSRGDEFHILEERFALLTDRILAETEVLEHQAMHDALTGLPNRMLLHDRLGQAIFSAQRDSEPLALLMMDLDRFKEINDTLGHHVGDEMLKAVSHRLQGSLRRTDTIARLGGDEFAVVLPDTSHAQAREICAKLIQAVDLPVIIDGHSLDIGISIGVALYPDEGDDANVLMQKADVAMYVAKRHGSGFAFYDPHQDEYSVRRLALMGELRNAIENDLLELHYQPMVHTETGKIFAVEALVRWCHPERGYIPPDEFIPLAERADVIRLLTLWVFDHAMAQNRRWREQGLELRMSLNVSVRCLHDKHFPAQVKYLLDKHDINPASLTLEVTESAIMSDPELAQAILTRLANMGLGLAIDDYGTGYSSLSYLKQLPVHELKIDRSFVTHMAEDENDAVIVRATVDLAHNMGLRVVAEGIEGSEVWDLLLILGCDVAQGYYIKRPGPAQEIYQWWKDNGGYIDTLPNYQSSRLAAN